MTDNTSITMACQHCYARVWRDDFGTLHEIDAIGGKYAGLFCKGTFVQHAEMPQVNADA